MILIKNINIYIYIKKILDYSNFPLAESIIFMRLSID